MVSLRDFQPLYELYVVEIRIRHEGFQVIVQADVERYRQ